MNNERRVSSCRIIRLHINDIGVKTASKLGSNLLFSYGAIISAAKAEALRKCNLMKIIYSIKYLTW